MNSPYGSIRVVRLVGASLAARVTGDTWRTGRTSEHPAVRSSASSSGIRSCTSSLQQTPIAEIGRPLLAAMAAAPRTAAMQRG